MEQNKVLMIIVSVAILFAAVVGVGVALLYPRHDGVAAIDRDSTVREFDPIEYVRRPERAPLVREDDDPVIIVFGDTEPEADVREEEPQRVITQRPARPPQDAAPARAEDTAPPPGHPQPAAEPARPAPSAPTPAPAPSAGAPATREAAPRQIRVTEYWIQLIASPSRDRVQQAEARLTDYNVGGRITTRDVGGELFYRLRVGPYSTRAEAEGFLEQVRSVEGFEQAYISEEYPLRTVSS